MTLQKNRLFWVLFSSLFVISITLGVASAIPTFKDFVRQLIVQNSRQILAKAESEVGEQGERLVVLKVKTADSLALEVFLANRTEQRANFLKRIVLPERRDGFFSFRGNAENLVMADVDGDRIIDIIAPTFDDNLMPRLNVFKYIPDTKDFVRMGPEDFEL